MQPTIIRPATRPSPYLLTALIVGLALFSMNRANAVLSTANEMILQYNLEPDAELAVAIPVQNIPVHLMITCDTVSEPGVAFVEMLRAPGSGANAFLMWTGQNSHPSGGGTSTNVFGSSSTDETKIADVNLTADVALEVQNATSVAISNNSLDTRKGRVTMFW